jgi:uncharacterized protein YcfL
MKKIVFIVVIVFSLVGCSNAPTSHISNLEAPQLYGLSYNEDNDLKLLNDELFSILGLN